MADKSGIRTYQMTTIEIVNGVSSDELSFQELLDGWRGETLGAMMAAEVGAAPDSVFCVDGNQVSGDTIIDENFVVKERIMAVKAAGRKG